MTPIDDRETCDHMRADAGTLSVWLSPDRLCALSASDSGKLSVRSWTTDPAASLMANLKSMLTAFALSGDRFSSVNAVVCSPRMTVVPAQMYDVSVEKPLFDTCFDLGGSDVIVTSELHNAGCVALFAFNRFVRRYLATEFTDVRCHNTFALLLEHWAKVEAGSDVRIVHVHVYKDVMGVYGFDGGRLVFTNTFECAEDNLRLFYVMHVWRALSFSQLDDTLCISFEGGAVSGLDRLAKLYVENVTVMGKGPCRHVVEGDVSCLTTDMTALLMHENEHKE